MKRPGLLISLLLAALLYSCFPPGDPIIDGTGKNPVKYTIYQDSLRNSPVPDSLYIELNTETKLSFKSSDSNLITGFTAVLEDSAGAPVSTLKMTAAPIAEVKVGTIGKFTFTSPGKYRLKITSQTDSSAYTGFETVLKVNVGSKPVLDAASLAGRTDSIKQSTPVTLSVTASGAGLKYQWYRGGTALAVETLPTMSTVDAGVYYCNVSNAWGTVSSANMIVKGANIKPVWKKFDLLISKKETRQINLDHLCADPEGKPLVYSLFGTAKLNASISGSQLTVKMDTVLGAVPLLVSASDGTDSAVGTLNITVSSSNLPPDILIDDSVPTLKFFGYSKTPLSIDFKAYDPDGDSITYKLLKNTLAGGSLNGSVYTWNGLESDAGTGTVSVEASDPSQGKNIVTITIELNSQKAEVVVQSADPKGGTVMGGVQVSPPVSVSRGQAYAITAKPYAGYMFDRWKISSGDAALKDSLNPSTQLLNIAAATTVTAYFAPDTLFDSLTLAPGSPIEKSVFSKPSIDSLKFYASDRSGVESVSYRLNGGSPIAMNSAGSNLYKTGALALNPGSNELIVTAVDKSTGKLSKILRLEYFYEIPAVFSAKIESPADKSTVDNLADIVFEWSKSEDKNYSSTYEVIMGDNTIYKNVSDTTAVIPAKTLKGGSPYTWRLKVTTGKFVKQFPSDTGWYRFTTVNHPSVISDLPEIKCSINDAVTASPVITDAEGLLSVEYFVNSTLLQTNEGGSALLDLSKIASKAGTYELKVVATDSLKAKTEKKGVITVTNGAPVIDPNSIKEIVLPWSKIMTAPLNCSASDEDPADQLQYFYSVNGEWVAALNGKFNYGITNVSAPSKIEVKGKVVDRDGNKTEFVQKISIEPNVVPFAGANLAASERIVQFGQKYLKLNLGETAGILTYTGNASVSSDLTAWSSPLYSMTLDTYAGAYVGTGFDAVTGDVFQMKQTSEVGSPLTISSRTVSLSPASAGTLTNRTGALKIALAAQKSLVSLIGYGNNVVSFGYKERTALAGASAYKAVYDTICVMSLNSGTSAGTVVHKLPLEMIINEQALKPYSDAYLPPYYAEKDHFVIVHGRTSRNLSKITVDGITGKPTLEKTLPLPASIDGTCAVLRSADGDYYIVQGASVYLADFNKMTFVKAADLSQYAGSAYVQAVMMGNSIIVYTTSGVFEVKL